jgi:hypothetical protein
MNRPQFLPWPVFKEFRTLSPAWLGCIVAMVVPMLTPMPQLALVAYFLGAALLGSLSVGHEYLHRTLSLQLALPIRRQRLLVVKLGVLAVMLATLAAVAYAAVLRDGRFPPGNTLSVPALPLLLGLFVAPWLTMALRSPAAGAVLSLAIPSVLAVASTEVESRLGLHGHHVRLSWVVLLATCAVGAVATWRAFLRLEEREALEDLRLMPWPRTRLATPSPAATRRHPFRRLVAKELRVQHLAPVVAGLYVLAWLACLVLPGVYGELRWTLSGVVYGPVLGMLIGTVASAEERQLGTIEWQVLQPVAMWKQWGVKAIVVFGLAAVLGKGLPTAMDLLAPTSAGISFPGQPPPLSVILLLTAGTLYVSTLCSSGALAFLAAGPAVLVALWFRHFALSSMWRAIAPAWWLNATPRARTFASLPVIDVLDGVFEASLVAILVWFAMENHRSADRSPWRTAGQVAVVATIEAVRVAVLSGAAAWLS